MLYWKIFFVTFLIFKFICKYKNLEQSHYYHFFLILLKSLQASWGGWSVKCKCNQCVRVKRSKYYTHHRRPHRTTRSSSSRSNGAVSCQCSHCCLCLWFTAFLQLTDERWACKINAITSFIPSGKLFPFHFNREVRVQGTSSWRCRINVLLKDTSVRMGNGVCIS